MRTLLKPSLNEVDRQTLEQWVKSRAVAPKQKLRARIILMTAEGRPTEELMGVLKVSTPTLNLWRKRYQEGGPAALVKGKTQLPGTPSLPTEKVQDILVLTQ
ncbi:helix-turn-helix domain-containing protein [Methylocaldum sp.]|uniref:helix-turn-helix domain-containing protein n=1 Tax=Methylocaldum sp. TaxID=1969727 RepID=UPI002D78380C|nr:helix-turn-helix domain-containing protein [Methylocaldum sp.]